MRTFKGNYAEPLGLLQERYGHAKEQAEREINDWAKRVKVYSAPELTTLRDDVASLSASVGELVRRQAAVTTGLDQTLAASKLKLEEKANEAVDHINRHSPDKCRLKTTLRLFVVIGKPGSPRTRLRRV